MKFNFIFPHPPLRSGMEILKLNKRNSKTESRKSGTKVKKMASPSSPFEITKKTLEFLKRGKVIVFPTDTVYGLICDAKNKKAVEEIFKIKKRSFQKTVSIFVKDLKIVKELAVVGKEQDKFLKKSWPGKIIIVLKAKKKFPEGIICPKGKIGLRMPNYKLLNEILNKFNGPLAQTSANISGQPASIKIKEVLKQFEGRKHQPDLVINVGNLKKARPSKVVDLTIWPLKILRF